MAIGALEKLVNIFKGGDIDPADKQALLEEVFLTALGRATSADTNVAREEVEMVQELYQKAFGKEVEAGEVRRAAHSEIFESTPLESYVKAAGKKLDADDKQLICSSLVQVMGTDDRISPKEVDFFNTIINALDMTPAELVGLKA